MNYNTETVRAGVLNDDLLHIASDGFKFKGGYKAIVEYYIYANEWGNNKHYKRFKTVENARKFIDKLTK